MESSSLSSISWTPTVGQSALVTVTPAALVHRAWLWDESPDAAVLQKCVDKLIVRHELLRTRFAVDHSRRIEAITGEPQPVAIHAVDLTHLDREQGLASARAVTTDQIRNTVVDVARGPLFWVDLFALSDGSAVLVLIAHHCVCDAWSCAIFCAELKSLYESERGSAKARLPRLTREFRDYAAEQNAWLISEEAKPHIAYWRNKLATFNKPFWLPADDCANEECGSRTAVTGEVANPQVLEGLRSLSRQERCTPFTSVAAAFAATLARWRGLPDAQTWIMHSGRDRPDIKGVIGLFAESWMLGIDLTTAVTGRDVVRVVWKASLEARPHMRVTPRVAAGSESETKRTTFASTIFNFLPYRNAEAAPSLKVHPIDIVEKGGHFARNASFAMVFNVMELKSALSWSVYYNTGLFRDTTIRGLSDRFAQTLADLAGDPDRPLPQ